MNLTIKDESKSRMILFETHTHTSGASYCSQIPPQDMPRLLKNAGVNSFMLTNHYAKWQMESYAPDHKSRIKRYLEEYQVVKHAAERINIPIILGAEVAIHINGRAAEFILFGVSENFLTDSPVLYEMNQKELYKLCAKNGIPMYQAHPFRAEHGHKPADPEFMDGVEVNLHSSFLHDKEQVYEFADKYGLGISCGSDIHYKNQAGAGGIVSDEVLDTAEKVAAFMKTHKRPQIYIR